MKNKGFVLILLLSLCLIPQISFADVVEDSDYISGGDNYQIEKDLQRRTPRICCSCR